MTSSEVIAEIKRMPAEERQKVIHYTRLVENEQLTLEELEPILKAMAESTDPAQQERLQAEFLRGYYGNEPHA